MKTKPMKIKTLRCRKRINRLGDARYFVDGVLGKTRVQKYFETYDDATDYMNREAKAYDQLGDAFISLGDNERVTLYGHHLRAQEVGYTLFDAISFYERHRHREGLPAAPAETRATEPTLAELPAPDAILISEAGELMVADCEARLIQKKTYDGYLMAVRGITREAGDCPVNQITEAHVKGYVNQYSNPNTSNTYLTAANAFLSWCVKNKHLATSPSEAIDKKKVGSKSQTIFSIATIKRLLRKVMEVRPEAINYYALCIFAGVRPEEVDRMTEEDVSLKEGYVEITVPKTGGYPRMINIDDCGPLRAWLESTGGFFPDDGKGNLKRRNWDAAKEGKFRNKFQQIYRECGWQDWPTDAMRKTFCSYHKEAFQSPDLTNKIAGHGADVAKSNYDNVVTSLGKPKDKCSPEELAEGDRGRAKLTRAYAKKLWQLTPDKLGK
jgi:integrase